MIPILFEYNVTDFTTHGIGDLIDCIECKSKQTSEGEYELSFSYPANGELFGELQIGRIILAKVNEYNAAQRFRIYGIESGINQTVTVNCQHISYDLANYPVKIFKDLLSPAQAIASIKQNIIPINSGSADPFPFTISGYQIQGFNPQKPYTRGDYVIQGDYTWQAIENIAAGNAFNQEQWTVLEKFKVESPKNVREILLDGDDSVLGFYGGDVVFDNTSVNIEKTAGQNRGVTIEYGVDLVDFNQDKNITEMVTGVLPYWKGSVRHPGDGSLGKRFEVYTGDQFEEGYTYYTRNSSYTPTGDSSFNSEKTYYIQTGNTYSGITLDDMDFKSGTTYYEPSGFGYIPTTDASPQPSETYYILENGTYRELNADDLDFNPDEKYYELYNANPDPDPNKSFYVVVNYDDARHLDNVSVYNENDKLIYQRKYTIDENTDYIDADVNIDELSYLRWLDDQGRLILRRGYYGTSNLIIEEQYANAKPDKVIIFNQDNETVITESYVNGSIYLIDAPEPSPDSEPDPDPDSNKAIYVVIKYDNDNNLTSASVYNKNAVLIHRRTYTKDANTSHYTVTVDIDELEYDEEYESGALKYRRGYDKNRNRIIQEQYADGKLIAVYIFNNDHDVILESYIHGEIYYINVQNPDQEPEPSPDSGKTIYVAVKYDNENNLVSALVYDKNSNLIYRRKYTRDENTGRYIDADYDFNELSIIGTYDQYGVIKYKNQYNESGDLIVRSEYTNGVLQVVYIYNDDHRVITETYNDGEIYTVNVTDPDIVLDPDPEPTPDPDPEPTPDPDPDQVIFVVPNYDDGHNLVGVSVYDKNANLFYKKTYVKDSNTGKYIDVIIDIDNLKHYNQQLSDGIVTHRYGWYWSDATAHEAKLIVMEDYNKENGLLQTIHIRNRDLHDVIIETYDNGVIYDVAVTEPDSEPTSDPDPEPIPDPEPTPDPDKLIYVVRERDDDNKLHTISVYVGDNNLVYQRRYDADNAYIDIDELEYVEETESSTIKRRKGYDASQRYIVNETYKNDAFSGLLIYGDNSEELVYESYKNEIRTVRIRDYNYYDSVDSNASTSVALTYDNENNLVNASVYDKNANLTYRRIYTRDANTDKYTDAVDDVNKLNHEEVYVSGKLYTINYKDAFGCMVVRVDYREGKLLDTVILNKDNNNIVNEVYSTNTGELARVDVDAEYANEIINPNSDRDPILDPDRDVSIVLKYNLNKEVILVSVYDKNASLIHQRRYIKDTDTDYINVVVDVDELSYTDISSQGVITGLDASGHRIIQKQYYKGNLSSVTVFNQDYKCTVDESYSTNNVGKVYLVSGYNNYADDVIYLPTLNVEEDDVQAASITTLSALNKNVVRTVNILSSNSNELTEENNDNTSSNDDEYVLTPDKHYMPDKTYYIEKQVSIIDDGSDGGIITYIFSPVSAYDLIFKSNLTIYTRSINGYKKTTDTTYQRGKNYYLATSDPNLFIPVDFENLAFRSGTTYFEETGYYVEAKTKQPGVIYYVSEDINDKDVIVYGNIQYADGFASLPASAQKIEPLDLSEFFEAEKESQVPTAARLNKRARQYILANDIGIPAIDLTVQYANLQQDVRLFDAVTVKFPKLGISTTAKVSSYSYDVLREICTEIEVKNAKASSNWSTLEDASRLRKGLIAPSRIGKKSITGDQIGTGQIGSSNIASYGVGTPHLQSMAVTDSKLADGSVKESKIDNSAVTVNKIHNGAVIEAKIDTNAVSTSKIQDEAISRLKCDKEIDALFEDLIYVRDLFAEFASIGAGNVHVLNCGMLFIDGYKISPFTHEVYDHNTTYELEHATDVSLGNTAPWTSRQEEHRHQYTRDYYSLETKSTTPQKYYINSVKSEKIE